MVYLGDEDLRKTDNELIDVVRAKEREDILKRLSKEKRDEIGRCFMEIYRELNGLDCKLGYNHKAIELVNGLLGIESICKATRDRCFELIDLQNEYSS